MSEHEKLELLGLLADGDEAFFLDPTVYAEMARDTSPEVRRLAVQAMWDVADLEHIDLLTDIARHDPVLDVQSTAVSVLGVYIYHGVVTREVPESTFLRVRNFLLELAWDAAEPLAKRRAAVEALSFDQAHPVAELIAWAYRHENQDVNISAIFAMGRSQCERWASTIVRELGSKNRQRQLEAIASASESFLAAATPRLRNLALTEDKEIRLAAIWALAHAGGPGALEVLEMCAESQDDEVREAAEEAIMEYASLRDPEAGEFGFSDLDDD